MDLIESSNKYAVKREVLNNRKESLVCLVSGTIAQNTDPPTCHSVLSSNNGTEQRFLVNPKGSQKQTKVFSRIFEDAACRPNEQRVLCGQRLASHPLHNQDPCIIFFVTEDQELASGHKSHRGGPHDSSFRDRLEAAGIKVSKTYKAETLSEMKKANVPKPKAYTRGPENFLT